MTNQHNPLCEDLVLFITGELDSEEEERFRSHMLNCTYCREEAIRLQEAWQTLAYDVEEVEVPTSLKSEILGSIFHTKESHSPSSIYVPANKLTIWYKIKPFLYPAFNPLSTSIITVLMLLIIGLSWMNMELRNEMIVLDQKDHPAHTQVLDVMKLQSTDTNSTVAGAAYLIQQGNEKNLVVHLNQMPATQGNQAYQVWLLKDGLRYNAGTFRIDLSGEGILTYKISDPNLTFEAIGITLEPDPYGTQPRGQKVLGSS